MPLFRLLSVLAFGWAQLQTGIVERCQVVGISPPSISISTPIQGLETNVEDLVIGGDTITVTNISPTFAYHTSTNFEPFVTNGVTIVPVPTRNAIREMDAKLAALSRYFVNPGITNYAQWLSSTINDDHPFSYAIYTDAFPKLNMPTALAATGGGAYDPTQQTNMFGQTLVYWNDISEQPSWYGLTRYTGITNSVFAEWHYISNGWTRADNGMGIDNSDGYIVATNILPDVEYASATGGPPKSGTATLSGWYFEGYDAWSTSSVSETIGAAASRCWYTVSSGTVSVSGAATGDVVRVVTAGPIATYGLHPGDFTQSTNRLAEREAVLGLMTHTVADPSCEVVYEWHQREDGYAQSDDYGTNETASVDGETYSWRFDDPDSSWYHWEWRAETITVSVAIQTGVTFSCASAALYLGTESMDWEIPPYSGPLPYANAYGNGASVTDWGLKEELTSISGTNATFTAFSTSKPGHVAFTPPSPNDDLDAEGGGADLRGRVLLSWDFAQPE